MVQHGSNHIRGLQVSVLERKNACTGIPVSRVDPVTKNQKGPGSRGFCAECHNLTNNFCITCRRWLCSPHLPANRTNSKKFDMNNYAKGEEICGVLSCSLKGHQKALEKDGTRHRVLNVSVLCYLCCLK